jgi:RimJ/RimL family protein N-acetyltransferase
MEITQRTATLSDAAILLNWRNNSRVREFSMYSNLILIDEHLKWFTARLERVQFEPFYVFEVNKLLIGMSRLDVMSGEVNKYSISILVDPTQHGKGVGKKILNMTCENFLSLHPATTLVASVHKYNLVSQKLFISSGFELIPTTGDFLHYEKHL